MRVGGQDTLPGQSECLLYRIAVVGFGAELQQRAWHCVSHAGIAARSHAVQLSGFPLSRGEVAFRD